MKASLGAVRKHRENSAARWVTLRKQTVSATYHLAEGCSHLTPIKAPGPNVDSFPPEMVPRPQIHHRNLWSVGTLSRSDVLDVLETAPFTLNGEMLDSSEL